MFSWTTRQYRAAPLAALLMCGCTAVEDQSVLHPAGPAAAQIAWLSWFMFGAFTAVFILVLVLLLIAILLKPPRPGAPGDHNAYEDHGDENLGPAPVLGRTGFIVAGGIVLPVFVLTPLFVLSLTTSASLRQPNETLTIRVVGHMWWWEVRYPEHNIVTANEIHIPAGQPVRLELASADVIHTFWVPRLNGKRDMIPGIETVFWIQADEPGVYRGQCSEYCGTQHANMAFQVIALPPREFETWLEQRKAYRAAAATSEHRRGFSVFLSAGCPQCHVVHGTPATGNVGPDLTHLGSRQMIGAAMQPNTHANLASWIADPQALKPGIKMPRTDLNSEDLTALVTYLESLK